MKIECEGFNKKVGDRISAVVQEFAVYLPDWVHEVNIRRLEKDTELAMGVTTDKKYRRLIIYISDEALGYDDAKFQRHIAHEFAHAYNSDIRMCVDKYLPTVADGDVLTLLEDMFQERIEEQTEDLSLSILRLHGLHGLIDCEGAK